MDFWKAAIMKPADIFELTGQTVNKHVFTVHPTGNLIHVLLEPPPGEYGHIKIPDTLVQLEKMGVGYIIAAGPMAGDPAYAAPGPAPIGVVTTPNEGGDASSLLGLHVIFASHVGMPLRLDMLDREFRAPVIVMTSKDIRGVDENPVPLSTRAMEKVKGGSDE